MKRHSFFKTFLIVDAIFTIASFLLLINAVLSHYEVGSFSEIFKSISQSININDHIKLTSNKLDSNKNEYFEVIKGKEITTKLNSDITLFNITQKEKFIKKIRERTEKEVGDYTILIKDLKTSDVINIGPKKQYPPASTFKVYTATLVLRDIQSGSLNWGSSVQLSKGLVSPGPGTYFKETDIGKSYTVENLLWRMVVQSDNTAQSMLFALLGKNNIEERLKTELELKETSLIEFKTSSEDMSFNLERLYRKEVLNEGLSNHLINLMVQGYARDRIKAGVPSGTRVANKGGTLPTSKHDVAIVFSDNTNYILIVYTEGIVEANAVQTIKDISTYTWDYFLAKEYE